MDARHTPEYILALSKSIEHTIHNMTSATVSGNARTGDKVRRPSPTSRSKIANNNVW